MIRILIIFIFLYNSIREMNSEEIYIQYRSMHQKLSDCTSRINMYIFKKLYNIEGNHFVTSRLKKIDSLAFNIEQGEIQPSSILQIKDIIGIRVICLSESKVKEIVSEIQKILSIVEIRDTKTKLGEDQFGYTSIHLIGKLTSKDSTNIRNDVSEDYTDILYEIQVRTFAQNIFADLSHKYSYKSGKYIPPEIKRSLFRIAALSEVIDSEINKFENEREKYILTYLPNDEESINIENIKLFFKKNLDAFRNIGLMEDYEGLINDLSHFGVKRISDLKRLYSKHFRQFRKLELRKLDSLIKVLGIDDDWIKEFKKHDYIFSRVGTIRGILNQEFQTEWIDYKREHIEKPALDILQQKIEKIVKKG